MDFTMADLGSLYGISSNTSYNVDTSDAYSLDMEDFIQLMVTTLQNQTIDDTADMGEMMSQFVQMSVVSALSELSELISDSTVMTYAASLVGKEVTVGQYVDSQLVEIQGTVTGTGMLNGQQVIFLDDSDAYYLTDIMAVGKLPDKVDIEGTESEDEDTFIDEIDLREKETESSITAESMGMTEEEFEEWLYENAVG